MTTRRLPLWTGLAMTACLAAGPAFGADLKLSGDQEAPPVKTTATGTGTISVAADGAVTGSVTTSGVAATAAHIHQGAPGKSGPVVLPLTKSGDNGWAVPAGSKLTPEQLKAYKAGELYVNVHSAANKDGEIRAQIKP
ncbi:MAG TPA: CHRD domain-containing protein [Ideonella sp.]|nr:CHRD domain-containing protein [Ideonella sp.]